MLIASLVQQHEEWHPQAGELVQDALTTIALKMMSSMMCKASVLVKKHTEKHLPVPNVRLPGAFWGLQNYLNGSHEEETGQNETTYTCCLAKLVPEAVSEAADTAAAATTTGNAYC